MSRFKLWLMRLWTKFEASQERRAKEMVKHYKTRYYV